MKKICASLMVFAVLLSCFILPDVKVADAASEPYKLYSVMTYGEKTFSTKFVKKASYPKQDMTYLVYDLLVEKDGKQSTVEKNVIAGFFSNKRYIYYTKIAGAKNTIYKYDMKTGKKTKVISGKKFHVMGCNGKYLYYGILNQDLLEEALQTKVYAYDLKKKTKKYMVSKIGKVTCYKTYVLLAVGTMGDDNTPIYLFKEDGTKIKKLATAMNGIFKGDKIYCTTHKYENEKMYYKVISFSLDGSNKKTVVDWTDAYERVEAYQ